MDRSGPVSYFFSIPISVWVPDRLPLMVVHGYRAGTGHGTAALARVLADREYDVNSKLFLSRQFLYIHAAIIQRSLSQNGEAAYPDTLSKEAYRYLSAALPAGVRKHKDSSLLGFDSDRLMYGETDAGLDSIYLSHVDPIYFQHLWGFTPAQMHAPDSHIDSLYWAAQARHVYNEFNKGRVNWERPFLRQVIWHGLEHSSEAYVRKVWSQVRYYFDGHFIDLAAQEYQVESIKVLPPVAAALDISDSLHSGSDTLLFAGWQVSMANLVIRVIFFSYVPVLLLSILCLVMTTRRIMMVYVMVHLMLVFTVAGIHTFDNGRYAVSFLCPLLVSYLSLCMMIGAVMKTMHLVILSKRSV